ncbi:hypothetical protein AHiyo8_03280 [Arthrobacter sp. Hiyo8]|nr:hypothetical protein AHiyo8_03280 [Arthrobacter sp. Hiyo8]
MESACHAASGILAALASATWAAVVLGSNPPITMPSGLVVSAWLKALWIPAGVPSPSMTLTFQPIAAAAS